MTEDSIMKFIIKFMIIVVISSFAESGNSTEESEHEPLEFVELYAQDRSNAMVKIRMNRISKPFLANTNVSVWLINGGNSTMKVSPVRTMDKMGKFDLYHDTDNHAAAVFFRKTGTFVGTIGTRLVLEHTAVKALRDYPSLLERNRRAKKELKSTGEKHVQKIPHTTVRNPEIVYIEVLVIVNYDIKLKFEHKAKIVTAVLTGFNSADLLFSKVENPKIKLNIAGIAIASSEDSLPELMENKCYKMLHSNQSKELHATCALLSMEQVLERLREYFPFNSYDIVVFLTGYNLDSKTELDDDTEDRTKVDGMSSSPEYPGYEGYRLTYRDLRAAVVKYTDTYMWFPVLAHELAHLFNVEHDERKLDEESDECTASIMRMDNSFCEKCLRFSNETLEQMTSFFNSREGCIFRNEPVSLNYPQKPTLNWSLDEQCQCYGFSRASRAAILKRLQYGIEIPYHPIDFCTRRIKCLKEYGHREIQAGIYMDNSECGPDRVCFREKCKKLTSL